MALTPGQLTTIYTIAGLYGNEQGWVDEAAVNELAIYIGAVTGDDFNVAYNNRLAVECLKVAVARGVTGERTESLRRRIQELLSRPAAAIISPTGDAALNAEIAARISGDNVEALARSDADTALGVRIDGVAAGADDATARAAAATAQALAEANETKINTNAGNITAVRDAGVRRLKIERPLIRASAPGLLMRPPHGRNPPSNPPAPRAKSIPRHLTPTSTALGRIHPAEVAGMMR